MQRWEMGATAPVAPISPVSPDNRAAADGISAGGLAGGSTVGGFPGGSSSGGIAGGSSVGGFPGDSSSGGIAGGSSVGAFPGGGSWFHGPEAGERRVHSREPGDLPIHGPELGDQRFRGPQVTDVRPSDVRRGGHRAPDGPPSGGHRAADEPRSGNHRAAGPPPTSIASSPSPVGPPPAGPSPVGSLPSGPSPTGPEPTGPSPSGAPRPDAAHPARPRPEAPRTSGPQTAAVQRSNPTAEAVRTNAPRPVPQTSPWLEVLDAAIQMSAVHHRAELQEYLSGRRTQLLHPQLRVLVTGAAGQGKSHLVNALINAPVCPVSSASPSAVATVVRHGESPAAHLITRTDPTTAWTAPAGARQRVALPTDRLPDAVAEAVLSQPPAAASLMHAEVEVPRALLASGVVLIDAPGLAGLPEAGHDAVADLRALATYACADLVLFTCEATREVTEAELDVLADLARLYPHVVVALTKTDVAPSWRHTLAYTRDRLTEAGVPATVIALSSTLREHAVRSGSQPLNDESGYPHLIAHLQHSVAGKQDELARATVSLIGRLVVERIAKPLRADLRHSAEPSDAVAQLHAAQRRLEDLRRITTRWQNCLADETGDLMSDIEQDLRERTRAVLAEAEKTLDSMDPASGWDEFEPWLRQAVQEAAEASFAWLTERADWLAYRVAEQFPEYADQIVPPWIAGTVDEVPDRAGELSAPPVERFTATQKLFTGLRGSYGGILMVGLATSMAGMSLINPISIGGGALFGGRTIREESKSLLKRRQATAKLAVQRHIDQIFIGLAKDAKDSVRRLQRTLRDHYSGVTEDIHEAIMESLRSAKAEADRDLAARAQRARRIEHELDRLAELYTQAQALAPARNPAIAPAASPAMTAEAAGTAAP